MDKKIVSVLKKLFPVFDIVLNILLKPERNQVFFISFNGKYSDSPKYISEMLYRLNQRVKQVWVIDRPEDKQWLPSYIKKVKPFTLKYLLEKHKSKVIVENGAGDYLIIKEKPILIRRLLKNKRQLDISTWHGTPFKKIGIDIENIKEPNVFTTSDLMIAGNIFEAKIFKKCFGSKIRIWIIGKPRNDIFFSLNDGKKDFLKAKLGIPKNKKVLLYAPTYRDCFSNKFILGDIISQFNKIIQSVKNKFGGEWIFIVRLHHYENNSNKLNIFEKDYYNGNCYDDMNEYLAVTDILITDYSSSMFDFILCRKPIFLLVPDWDDYKKTRGTYFELSDLPFPYAHSIVELREKIEYFSKEDYIIRVERFINSLGFYENGTASERTADLILKYLDNDCLSDSIGIIKDMDLR